MPDYNFSSSAINPIYPKLRLPNIIRENGNFICSYRNTGQKITHNKILTYYEDFNLLSARKDTQMAVIQIISSKDTNTFLVHCLNTLTRTYEIRYIDKSLDDWEIIKTYRPDDSVWYIKEIDFRGRRSLVLQHSSLTDTTVSIDLMDVDSMTVREIYRFKYNPEGFYGARYNAACSDGDTLYLSICDTLFHITNPYDRESWKYLILPNNGKGRITLEKFGDRFFAKYGDSLTDESAQYPFFLKPLREAYKPESAIMAGDIDFGQWDINSSAAGSRKITIENPSDNKQLIIDSVSLPQDAAFSCELPEINAGNPLLIDTESSFEFDISFKPEEERQYMDSIVFHSNAAEFDSVSYLSGEGIDTSVTVKEIEIEARTYLYCYPPFPLPARTIVRALIYWDPKVDIDKDEIYVTNLYGSKIAAREYITINKLANYKGHIEWNCGSFQSGVYFIHIKHGTNAQTIKVMLQK